jgi:hypothetical protein
VYRYSRDMGSFTASLRSIGDVRALPATVELSDGRLSIVAGSTEIGSWSLDEIHLEETPTGYRMAAEGDQILIELKDAESFAAELATRNRKRRRMGKRNAATSTGQPAPTEAVPVVAQRPVIEPSAPLRETAPASSPDESTRSKGKSKPARDKERARSGTRQGSVGLVDSILARAQKRFGPYLPDWLFSRAMLFIAVAGLIAMFLLPGLFSVLLLITGALLVLFGAIVYSDTVLASKWLPGRATPVQALLLGLSVLMLGVLLGMLAN